MACKFLTDHRDSIKAKVKKTMNETGHEIDELMLDLNFAADESGIVPALSNPPQFEILSVENALQTRYLGQVPEDLKSRMRDLKQENQMLCVYHSPFGYNSIYLQV